MRDLPDGGKTIQELALAASVAYDLPPEIEPFFDETSYYDPPNCTFPFGTHICVVEVDRDTGHVVRIKYIAVDDVGNVLNPLIVDGQVHGGIAQGLAQALYEGAYYNDDGQLITGRLCGLRRRLRPGALLSPPLPLPCCCPLDRRSASSRRRSLGLALFWRCPGVQVGDRRSMS